MSGVRLGEVTLNRNEWQQTQEKCYENECTEEWTTVTTSLYSQCHWPHLKWYSDPLHATNNIIQNFTASLI
jgi:hypothetical protein